MKLVEILARELKEWPEGAPSAEQDHDKEVRFMGGHGVMHNDFFARELAEEDTDHSCSDGIPYAGPVTQEMWQAERDRIAGVTVLAELQSTDGPLDWRDRIRAIDEYMIGEQVAHNRLMDAAGNERAELVAKLAAEGLALCAVHSAVIVHPKDWREYKEGDQVEVTGCDHDGWLRLKGLIGTVCLDECGKMRIEYDDADNWYLDDNCTYQFHSRP